MLLAGQTSSIKIEQILLKALFLDNLEDININDEGDDVEITTINPAIVNSENDEESNLSQVGLTWKMVEFELTIVLQNGRKHSTLGLVDESQNIMLSWPYGSFLV